MGSIYEKKNSGQKSRATVPLTRIECKTIHDLASRSSSLVLMDTIFNSVYLHLNKKQILDLASFLFAVLLDVYFFRKTAEPVFLVVSRMERTGYVVYPVLVTGLVGGTEGVL
jgi:hypothetical protein